MESIPLPNLKTIDEDKFLGTFEVAPLYPGFGQTIANTLRRVLLSSLEGYAVDCFRIENVDHEFSTIENVKEDVIEIMVNLKSLRFNILSDIETAELILETTKIGNVFASDFQKNSEVEILNPEQIIATVNKGGEFNLTLKIKKGRGYESIEDKEHQKEIGLIYVDSFYSPVRHVAFEVDDTRVGQATNFDKITLKVETDGSVSPRVAVEESAKILTEHFALISNIDAAEAMTKVKEDIEKQIEEVIETEKKISIEPSSSAVLPPLDHKMKIEDIDLSGRTKNALLSGGFKTLSGLSRLSEIKLAGIKGLGAKGLEEVKSILMRIEQ